MKRTFTFKKLAFCAALIGTGFFSKMRAQAIVENFDDVTLLAGNGWFQQNNSTPVGTNPNWVQGNATVFNSYNGATNSYIAANFNAVAGTNTISNWLVTPNRNLRNGDVVTFYTRKPVAAPTDYPDRLEVRMSSNGASTNVGTGATGVGDFTTLLLSVNPTLVIGGYPTTWTLYTITISGLTAPTSGRLAFRYFVTNGGPTGANSDYIGVDAFTYTPYVCPAFTLTAGGALTSATAGTAYSNTLTQTGALGTPSFAVTSGALPTGLTLSTAGAISGTPTTTGTFNFDVTVSDASGCTGTQSYSINVVCPANPISMTLLPVCINDAPVTLSAATPVGGTYSGTGVSAGVFDPTVGTQTITYDYTDPYSCPHSSTATITVHLAPVVSLGTLSAVCVGSSDITLSVGTPSGGTYSGTNVSSGIFSPIAAGTTDIIYTYTDANGCTEDDTASMTVNTLPLVTIGSIASSCVGSPDISLGGGSPAGGTYSGTNVALGMFSPIALGTTDVIYTFTDSNGCAEDDTTSITVNALPTVTMGSLATICEGSSGVTLSGGLPTGGTYSGANVALGIFSPLVAGSNDIIYSYTDSNGCTEDDTTSITVNALPTVTMGSLATICEGSSGVTLSGGLPTGGTYSGANVALGIFSPLVAGSNDIIYSYTDANGCTEDDTTSILVNAKPVVTHSSLSNVCVNSGNVVLSGGSPVGGTYTGSNVSVGNFSPLVAGTSNVTYTFADVNGCIDSAVVSITVDPCVGISENNFITEVRYFPNPNNGQFTLTFNQIENSDLFVSVKDIQGKEIASDKRMNFTGSYVNKFDLSNLAKGVYTLEIKSGTRSSYYKIVTQ